MYDNMITSTIPSTIALLSNLVFVDFDSNELEGSIATEFGLLTNMETLWLARNDLTGTIPTELAECVKMEEFFVFGNKGLTSPMPKEICALRANGPLGQLQVGCESTIECVCCTDECSGGGDGEPPKDIFDGDTAETTISASPTQSGESTDLAMAATTTSPSLVRW